MNNPFDIEIEKLTESEEISDEKTLLKLKLISEFLNEALKLDTQEVINKTGLHKSDYSRLKSLNYKRFTIDKIITLLSSLDLKTDISVSKKSSLTISK